MKRTFKQHYNESLDDLMQDVETDNLQIPPPVLKYLAQQFSQDIHNQRLHQMSNARVQHTWQAVIDYVYAYPYIHKQMSEAMWAKVRELDDRRIRSLVYSALPQYRRK